MSELFDKLTDANSLYDAYLLSKQESDWKASVQKYGMYLLGNIAETQRKLREGTYKQLPFVEFTLHERGKVRHIKSMHISDRVVQRSLCDNALIPALSKGLIYDNGASLKYKGIGFTRDRFECHLQKFFRKHGLDGYVLKVDFAKFFDNIPHEKALNAIAERIDDPMAMTLLAQLMESFKNDISYVEDASVFDTKPFNSLEHAKVPREKLIGEKYLYRSVGIGSQISQIIGIFYPTPIDTYCKVVKSCRFYGRYMDDIYVIHESKDFLSSLLEDICEIAEELGLFVNRKKTSITALKHGFTFLQVRYKITATGKIIKKLSPATFTRERKKLKAYSKLLDDKKITRKTVCNNYRSWRGHANGFNSHKSVTNMDSIYNHFFVEN